MLYIMELNIVYRKIKAFKLPTATRLVHLPVNIVDR